MHLAFFERDADLLVTDLERSHYLDRSGRYQGLRWPSIYERYAEVWSLDAYEQLLDIDADERVAPGLQRLVLEQFVRSAEARSQADIAVQERLTTVDWGGDTLPWRLAQQMVTLEPEREPRHELDEQLRGVYKPLQRLRLDRLRAAREQMLLLGQYDQPTDDLGFWATVRAVAVDEVSKLATWLLEETRELYLDALRDQLIHFKLDDGDAWEVDLEWLFRGEAYDRIFPDHRLMPTVTRMVWDLGIRLQDQTQVKLDQQDLADRVARSFVAPIGVPDEVVAVLAPRGGYADVSAMLRLVGEAERYAHADPTQSIVYRRFGDAALSEGYGLLFAGLLGKPDWLSLRLEADATRDAIRLQAFERLYRVRRAAASHLYEVELRKHPEPEMLESEYVDRFADALMVRPFAEDFLNVTDDPFAGARHLRAALFGSQLSAFLAQEHDEDWYRSARAGRFLVDRWREGQRYTAEELVQHLGYEGLDPSHLLEELRTALVG
ncbi:MAG: hypothetical protein IT306_07485 [Chloroflexi bacterium]|nr:hypothetical protein [Chloroflexota bacterium]